MENQKKPMDELTHLSEVFGGLDECIESAVEAKDTGQWSEAYEKKKMLDEKIDRCLENSKMLFQSGNVVWKFLNRDWIGAIIALLTLGMMGRSWWKRRSNKKNDKKNE